MSAVKIEGFGKWDGTYELNEGERAFNAREWRWIKQISGYMPATISDGFAGEDPDLFIAVAVIAMSRTGKIERQAAPYVAEQMAEEPVTFAGITLVSGPSEQEDDALPPALESESDESSPNASLSSSDTKTPSESSSGPTSRTSSERLAVTP